MRTEVRMSYFNIVNALDAFSQRWGIRRVATDQCIHANKVSVLYENGPAFTFNVGAFRGSFYPGSISSSSCVGKEALPRGPRH